jgi:hypothetical protein|tara:strand:+ start:95 stop:295 length:201 start_codon:yes stop_codon:yes gene_type:complete
MKHLLTLILSGIILFGAVPTVSAMDYSEKAGMEEVKKKKKKKGKKKKGDRGGKKKKGFFSKVFGSK